MCVCVCVCSIYIPVYVVFILKLILSIPTCVSDSSPISKHLQQITLNFTPSRVKSPPTACHKPGSSIAAYRQPGGHTHPSSIHCSNPMQAWGGREGKSSDTQVGIDNISFSIKTTYCQQSYLGRLHTLPWGREAPKSGTGSNTMENTTI